MSRLLSVILLTAAAVGSMGWVLYVEGPGPVGFANTLPMLIVVVLAVVTLVRGGGKWTGRGWQWPLATAGFAIPAVGLSLYLHYAWFVDLDGLASDAPASHDLFRWLPVYTVVAGTIGFAIGWIAGRNV